MIGWVLVQLTHHPLPVPLNHILVAVPEGNQVALVGDGDTTDWSFIVVLGGLHGVTHGRTFLETDLRSPTLVGGNLKQKLSMAMSGDHLASWTMELPNRKFKPRISLPWASIGRLQPPISRHFHPHWDLFLRIPW